MIRPHEALTGPEGKNTARLEFNELSLRALITEGL